MHVGEKRDLTKRTFEFAKCIVRLCRKLDQTAGVSRTMANQLLRSGTSIGANVEEGQAAQSRADFLSKYSISLKEARETHYWLRLLVATDIVAENYLKDLIAEANEIISILTAIVKKLKEK